MSFFDELKRRNVVKVGIAYLVATWILIQITDILVPTLGLPEWIGKATIFFLIIGFVPALIFAWAFEMTPEGIKREKDVDRNESITPQTGRKLDFVIMGLLAAGLVYFAWDKFVPTADESEISQVQDTVEQSDGEALPVEKSVAVLPFVNMSSDPEQEFFSDGISEEILNALAKVKSLKVAGRTSSFSFKGDNQDLRMIGEALGVNHILEGSVRKAGNTVRITAQLIQVEDGFHLWSETYDRELTNIFAIQDEIALAILAALKAELLDGNLPELASTATDTQAYEKYLLAKQRMYERTQLSLEAAAQLLDSAIEIDPDYAPAYAQRGIVQMLLVEDQYGDIPRESAYPPAKELLEKALMLDPDLAEAWAGLGLYHSDQPSQHAQAIEKLEKALSINPNMNDASNWLQIAYGSAGMSDKVLPILEGVLERDPLYRPAMANVVFEYNRLGMQEKSMALAERVRPFLPDGDVDLVFFRATTLMSLGRFAEAMPLMEEVVRRLPEDGISRMNLGFGLWLTHQYERLLDPKFPAFMRIFALDVLDRREEATILAFEEAGTGRPGPLLFLMNRSGRSEEVVRYVEERWPDLDSYEAVFPHGNNGHGMMLNMAFAYSRIGNNEKHIDAMRRVRKAHDQLINEGVKDPFFFWQEAQYYTLSLDFDKAIEQLEISINTGALGASTRIAETNPAFEPLEGDPRFEALQTKMVDRLNEERATLGLEPATI